MEKINRLGWAAGLSFVSHGVSIGIRVNDPAAIERLVGHLPPRWKPASSPVVSELCSLLLGGRTQGSNLRHYNLLYWGAGRVARTMDLDAVFEALDYLLPLIVAVRTRHRLFVRAAVVGWGGRAIVICGPPSSGRSTLAAALVRAGAAHYAGQYAVLDAGGCVHPYLKLLTPRAEAGVRSSSRPVENFAGRSGSNPLPVGLVVITQYDQPGTLWRPRLLSRGQALIALLTHTVQARLRPEVTLGTLRRALKSAITLKGKRGEAEGVVLSLLNQLTAGKEI